MKYCYDIESNANYIIVEENRGEYILESENKTRYIVRKSMFSKWFRML